MSIEKSGKVEAANSSTMEVLCKLIVADAEFNARRHMQGADPDSQEIKELANSIRRDGQLQPVLVERRKDGKYNLVFGFRRFLAISGSKEIGGLDRDVIRATVIDPTDDVTKMYLNLAENVSRENLEAYDLACRCFDLSKKHEQSGTKIANRLGKSVSYVNNLIRARENLGPVLLALWEAEASPGYKKPKICTTNNLVKWSKLSHEEQELELQKERGEKLDGSPPGEGVEGGEEGGEVVPKVRRATVSNLGKAYAATMTATENAKKAGSDPDRMSYLSGVTKALEFAIGEKDIIADVYSDEVETE